MHIYQLCSHGNLHNTVKNNQQKGRTPPQKNPTCIFINYFDLIIVL